MSSHVTIDGLTYETATLIQYKLPDGTFDVRIKLNNKFLTTVSNAIPGVFEDISMALPPHRALNVPWQPSLTRRTIVVATVRLTFPASNVAQAARIDIMCGPTNPPTARKGRFRREQSSGGINPSMVTTVLDIPLPYLVPVGWWIELRATVEQGTPTVSIAQDEQGRPMVDESYV